MSVHFYDSTQSSAIPSGRFAAYYINGSVSKWSTSEVRRMGYVFGISVSSDPTAARIARCLDAAAGDNPISDQQMIDFLSHRRGYGHDDGTIYVNAGNWIARHTACANAGHFPRWWVATLALSERTVPSHYVPNGASAWAVQYLPANTHDSSVPVPTGGNYDLSILYGVNDFHRPN